MAGLFITLEGGEGAGKSTQSKLLATRLGNAVLTREPGGTPAAEWIRGFILSGKAKAWGVEAEAVLFAAARLSHVTRKIAPALKRGENVICDRFFDSTRVYQGLNKEITPQFLTALEMAAAGNCRPNLTLLIDIPAEIGLARAASRGDAKDRFEGENLLFHKKLRDGFKALASEQPQRFVVIDGTLTPQEVHEKIWQAVQNKLNS